MPISYPDALTTIGWKILKVKPQSVLDIGCGCGLFGLLARQYTDVDQRRLHKESWTTLIEAIEVFPEYVNGVHNRVFDRVYIGNALDVLPDLDTYDLIICTDVIEHFSLEDGSKLLDLIKAHSKHAILSTPERWIPQKGVFGNDHETHLHRWTVEELSQWGTVRQLNQTLVLEITP